MKQKLPYILAGGLALALVITSIILFRPKSNSVFSSIQKKVGFTIFIPTPDNKDWVLDSKSVVYDSSNGILSYRTNTADAANSIVVTEQSLPDPFNDVPNYSSIFLSKLNEYKELTVPLGTVSLTRPSELNGGQSAVMNVRGTLMFMHPSKDLSDSDWTSFGKNLQSL